MEKADLKEDAVMACEANAGVYCFSSPWLWSALGELTPSANGELYLTSLAALAAAQGDIRYLPLPVDDPLEALGVNDGVQLARAKGRSCGTG